MKWTRPYKNLVHGHVENPFCYPERLILDPMKNTADPIPGVVIPDPIYLVMTFFLYDLPVYAINDYNTLLIVLYCSKQPRTDKRGFEAPT